jgi:hypothetical protein
MLEPHEPIMEQVVPPVTPRDPEDFELVENVPPIRPAVSSVNTVPGKLRDWYSQSSFKTISFTWLSLIALGLDASFLFAGKINGDIALAFVSTIIGFSLPSPYDSHSKKKANDNVRT